MSFYEKINKIALNNRFYYLNGYFDAIGELNPIAEDLYGIFASISKTAENKAFDILNNPNMDDYEKMDDLKELIRENINLMDL